jgi:peptidoglycan/xylan/chitin deacetylase (PgdA/CDA1 family)
MTGKPEFSGSLLRLVQTQRAERRLGKSGLILLVATALGFGGCGKIKSMLAAKEKPVETPVVQAAVTPAPLEPSVETKPEPVVQKQPEAPTKPAASTKGSVMVLCYHRFENLPKDSMAIRPEEFEKQLEQLKAEGFSVISMADFLAWRRGDMEIPEKSCVITLDDGWRSGYSVAWPLLKKHGYPFTMFIYVDYIKGQKRAGGQSMSWEELAEMRDAGVEIGSHTVSHTDLRSKKGKTPEQYDQWIREEIGTSKKLIEQKLGIAVKTLAYPYGNHNPEVRQAAMDAGYEAAFSVYGQRLTYHSPADQLGRYAVEGNKPQTFVAALKMVGGGGGAMEAPAAAVSQLAAAAMLTQPMEGETVLDVRPVLRANVASFGSVDPASLEMRLSGMGLVPLKYDAENKVVEGVPGQDLKDPSYTVILSGKVNGRRIETRWSFNFQKAGSGDTAKPVKK